MIRDIMIIFLRHHDQANKITNKQKRKHGKGKWKIFLYFCENVLEVGEMKMRGKWKIMQIQGDESLCDGT